MDLRTIVELLEREGWSVRDIARGTPIGRLLVTLRAAIAEFERSPILERQREGTGPGPPSGIGADRRPRAPRRKAWQIWYGPIRIAGIDHRGRLTRHDSASPTPPKPVDLMDNAAAFPTTPQAQQPPSQT